MSRGYLVIAQNNHESSYIRQAYALAMSIKLTQSSVNSIAIAVEDIEHVPVEYRAVFDYIITIPWTDHAANSTWKIENKWKYYYMTPFDETVVLDTDMIFTSDYSLWWDTMSQREAWFTSEVLTYRSTIAVSDYYRTTFTSNRLPNIYTAFFYFRKTEKVAELFKLTEYIFNNWKRFYYDFLDSTRPTQLSGDVAFALALKILGYTEDFVCSGIGYPTFVHMKSRIQDENQMFKSEDWTQYIPTYFRGCESIKIGNFKQTKPFHYHVKTWLTDEILRIIETEYERNVGLLQRLG